ncbi:hypothetical protein TRFO_25074 [Tritrichomonas foetus]|uniref:Guanylate cyclase domain-containing protein n=1 Tax=Tritrichomonas foetus TaxID=1144522 RepID=A0A1J4KAT9_9EUKA|nr:hypothetical protein TRFO_25074 [Tritrichomonas foetus]|eukprot:OHT06828.1 hypothetical protein TRFO_25074 [Tritrichomonas foetus]
MNQQSAKTHEIHGRARSKGNETLISSATNAFVVPFCVILTRIRASHAFCQIIFFVSEVIVHMQLFMTCTYPMLSDVWEQIPTSFNLTQIFTVFTRLLPQNLTFTVAARASYFICLIIVVSFTCLIVPLAFYRPNSVFSSSSLPYMPTIPIILLYILCFPMASLTTYFWFERENNNGYYPAVLCTVSFCFCFFGSRIYIHVLHCLPNFPKLYGVQWGMPQFYIKQSLYIAVFVVCEAMPYIPLQWTRILFVVINAVIFLMYAIESIYYCDGMILDFNILKVFTTLGGGIFHLISLSIMFTANRPGVYSSLILILSFPLLVFSYLICRSRIAHFHRVFSRAVKRKSNLELDQMNPRKLLVCIGTNLHLFQEDFSILDHITENNPENFDIISLYAKFAALTFVHFDKVHNLLVELKKLRNLNFAQQIVLTFIEILSLQDEKNHNQEKIGEMCSIVSTEFLRNLNLFWTEILLGRSERLISLATAVDNKYQTAVCLFTLLGTNRGKMSHSFEQFCSVSTLKVSDPVFPERYSFFKLLYEPKYQAVTYKDQQEALQLKNFRYQPPLRSVHISAFLAKYQKTIRILKITIVALPFIASIAFAIMPLIFSSIVYDYISPSWNLFYHLELAGVQIASVYAIHPFLLLSYYDNINASKLSREILNEKLFLTRMIDPYADMENMLKQLIANIPYVLRALDDYNYYEILDPIIKSYVQVSLTSYPNPVSRRVPFAKYLSIIPIRFSEQTKMGHDELIDYFNNSRWISLMINNSDLFLNNIIDFLYGFGEIAHKHCVKDLTNLAFNMEMVMLAVIVLFIILTIILVVILFRAYNKLFEPLFLLPKVSISELIDKLSSKPTNEIEEQEHQQVGSQITYNLKQLAYERPSQAFHTRKQFKFYILFVTIILIFLIRLLFSPIVSTLSNDSEEAFKGMTVAVEGYSTQISLLKTLRDIAELLCRYYAGLTVPIDRNNVLLRRIYTNTVDLQAELANISISGIDLPHIIDKNFYFVSPNNGTTVLANFTFVDKISYLYTQLYLLINTFQSKWSIMDTTAQSILEIMLSAISQHSPNFLDNTYSNALNSLHWMVDKCILLACISLYTVSIFYIIIRFWPTFSLGSADFAQPIFASIPPRSIHTFHQYLGAESDERSKDEDPHLAMSIFNDDSTFQTILDPLILTGSDGKIVTMSAPALQLFGLESIPNITLPEFLEKISYEHIGLQLPIIKPVLYSFHLKPIENDENSQSTGKSMHSDNIRDTASNPNIAITLVANVFPTAKFSTNGSQIFYSCLIEDVTKLSALIAQMNKEANRVRYLTVQLAPEITLDFFLEYQTFMSLQLPKLAIASFFIPTASESLDITLYVQEAIRDALHQSPSLTFFGRSVQMFRVISGLANTKTQAIEGATELILFSQRLMHNIIQLEDHLNISFDVRCGIHFSGPYIADVVSETPPVFELFGASMTISQQIAANAVPKHITISRDMYEAIFDQGFTITFEKEIRQIGGDEMSIHNVEPRSE